MAWGSQVLLKILPESKHSNPDVLVNINDPGMVFSPTVLSVYKDHRWERELWTFRSILVARK